MFLNEGGDICKTMSTRTTTEKKEKEEINDNKESNLGKIYLQERKEIFQQQYFISSKKLKEHVLCKFK